MLSKVNITLASNVLYFKILDRKNPHNLVSVKDIKLKSIKIIF